MFRKTLLLTLLITLLLAGCAPASTPTKAPVSSPQAAPVSTESPATEVPTDTAILFTDSLGREVKLAAPARRVVSLAPSLTEVLFAIGAGSQVVGRDEYSNYPEQALGVESIGSTYQTLNTEAILALDPDLVVAAGINSPEQIKALEDLGVVVYFFGNPVDFEGMYQHLEIMGGLTGHAKGAGTLVESLKVRVQAVEEMIAPLSYKPTVFYEIDSTDATKPWTSGPDTFMDTMITMAGGINIGGALSDSFAQISLEEIILQDPDFIILGDAKWGATIESIGKRPGWESLSAVKNEKIFVFDDDLASRPGPRLVDGLEALVAILHPEFIPVP